MYEIFPNGKVFIIGVSSQYNGQIQQPGLMQLPVISLEKKHSFSEVSNVALLLSERKYGCFVLNRRLRFGQEEKAKAG